MNTPSKGAMVFVVDDDAAVRDSISMLLETAGIPSQAFDSAEAFLEAPRTEEPGCLLLDMRMPGMGGLELQAELTRRDIRLPIIFLSVHADIPSTVHAIKAGAVDFLTKPVDAGMLLERVQGALERSRREHEHAREQQSTRQRLARLTERERGVLALALAGHPNKEIARRLGISFRTVEVYRSRILLKTGANTLLELARMMASTGVEPSLQNGSKDGPQNG